MGLKIGEGRKEAFFFLTLPLSSWVEAFVLKSEVWSSCRCLLGSRCSQAADVFLVSLGEVVHEHGDREGLVPQKEL